MKTVKEVSNLTGVSVRTLHHYDAIGLLKPSRVTEAGYRLYNRKALEQLQTILFFRELGLPLKEIREILNSPGFNPMETLEQQIQLLELQRTHLEDLITHARQIQKTGVIPMDFTAFDTREMDSWKKEAKNRWGKTDAYREYEQKTAGKNDEEMSAQADGLMEIFTQIGRIRTGDPASPEAQALISQLQSFITEHYYTCTKPILRGLGMMYIAGDSMTENIDRAGGEGTADFAHRAIEIFCA